MTSKKKVSVIIALTCLTAMTDAELQNETDMARLRRKRDQAWELAALARIDDDTADANRHTKEAVRIQERIGELLRAQHQS